MKTLCHLLHPVFPNEFCGEDDGITLDSMMGVKCHSWCVGRKKSSEKVNELLKNQVNIAKDHYLTISLWKKISSAVHMESMKVVSQDSVWGLWYKIKK
jgi:hypothetical protein